MGTVIDGGEARAKGKMSGWWTMQGNWVAEGATGGGGRMTQGNWAAEDANERGWRTKQGNQMAEATTRGGGGRHKAIGWWMTQREERVGLQ